MSVGKTKGLEMRVFVFIISFFPLPRTLQYDKYVTVDTKLPQYSGFEADNCDSLTFHYGGDEFPVASCQAAVHYCASNYRWVKERGKWGEQGYCTTSNKAGGTMNDIWRFDIQTAEIQEDGSLENDHFKWIGHRVNNIQISGSRLFAASSDKIRIYTINGGALTRVGLINADNPRNIRIFNDKLFVADGRQVSVWNISGDTPVFEREIETSYKVKDLEIVDGKLFVYEEETYWQWFWLRKRTKFEIIEFGTDEGDETVVYTNGVSCKDSEMMQDDNCFYLGCQDRNNRINLEAPFVGEAVDGEKRYFRDSYLYEDRIYQSFDGAVHVSK
ncbi:hypothetical protein KAH37_03850 [bacterium]|nr:hypothetical protein [bacterium]